MVQQVLPATLQHVVLQAELVDGALVTGESQISQAPTAIRRVFLEPGDVKPVGEAITAIAEADLVILGPGSLFTSIIPNLLVTEITTAIKAAKATKKRRTKAAKRTVKSRKKKRASRR